MMRIVFRSEAEADLQSIVTYFEDAAPHVIPDIRDDIERALSLLERHPQIGAPVPKRSFRRLVTRRYHFKIAYRIEADLIVILGLFRFQNRES